MSHSLFGCIIVGCLLLTSCFGPAFKKSDYSDRLLENRAKWLKLDFTKEYKRIKRYDEMKRPVNVSRYIYDSDGHEVEGYIFRSKRHSVKKGLIVYIRGGHRDFKSINVGTWMWLVPFLEQGYDILMSQYRLNKDAIDPVDYADKFGGGDVDDIENLINIYSKEYTSPKRVTTISWGSRGGITTYRFLNRTKYLVNKSVIIQGASDFKLLERSRGKFFFSFLSEDEKKSRDLSQNLFERKSVLLIHSKDNFKTPVEHAYYANTLLSKKNKVTFKLYETSSDLAQTFTTQVIDYIEKAE
jgi:dipeptidyl aminopeptidase/acylaminoacyl peptidase